MNYLVDQFTRAGYIAANLMVEYSYKYPKNFFGQPKINIRHSMYVRDFAVYLQKIHGGNLAVVEVAALFHDLGKISTIEEHETLIEKLLQKHRSDFGLTDKEFELLVTTCAEKVINPPIENTILHCADNLAFLYDAQYQEAFYRYVGTKTLLFEKRMYPKHDQLPLESAKKLGDAFYSNVLKYWEDRPEESAERYRPDIEGSQLDSLSEDI
jgi:hypothetical protein